MATTSLEYDEWRRGLAYQAEAMRQSIARQSDAEAFRVIQSIVENVEVVVGVWPDEAEADGFGTRVVKGKNLLADIASGRRGRTTSIRVAAIPCFCLEQAVAASQKWGGLH